MLGILDEVTMRAQEFAALRLSAMPRWVADCFCQQSNYISLKMLNEAQRFSRRVLRHGLGNLVAATWCPNSWHVRGTKQMLADEQRARTPT